MQSENLTMNGLQNTTRKPKPQLLHDTEALAVLLDDIQNDFTHRYKYGYGYKIQKLLSEMLECYHASQTYTDFNRRSEVLQDFLVKLDSINSILEILASRCGLPDSKLNLIYRQTDKIAKQTKGLRKYFAEMANNQRFTPPSISVNKSGPGSLTSSIPGELSILIEKGFRPSFKAKSNTWKNIWSYLALMRGT